MFPPTTDNLILSCLSPIDLINYSKTSRTARHSVNAYNRNAFNIRERLARYFSLEEILHFRHLQAKTGTLISGSTALQFFDRTEYPDSDLDIYVEQRYAFPIAQWLLRIGYAFVARKSQNPDLENAFAETPETFHETAGVLPSEEVGYFGRGVAGVFNFHKYRPDRKIQLITALHSPMEIILHFHSTCVMNIITHEAAYSLYPLATYEHRRSLVCATSGSKQDEARDKYVSRGWTMEFTLQPWEIMGHFSDFRMGGRWVGDKACWKIKIQPELVPASLDYIGSNSWKLLYSEICEAQNGFMILQTGSLHYRYIVADEEVGTFIDPVIGLQQKLVQESQDTDLNRLLALYYRASHKFRVNMC